MPYGLPIKETYTLREIEILLMIAEKFKSIAKGS